MFGLSLALSKSLLCIQRKYGVLWESYGVTKIKVKFQFSYKIYTNIILTKCQSIVNLGMFKVSLSQFIKTFF